MTRSTKSQNLQGLPDRQNPTGTARVELIIIRGRTRQRIRPVEGPVFLIGTAPDCDLVLVDDRFAPVQGYLFRHGETVQIRWLSSDPELTLNGQPRENATLADQDRIRTGTYEFLIRILPRAAGDEQPEPRIPAPHCLKPRAAASSSVAAVSNELPPTALNVPPDPSPGLNRATWVAEGRLRLFDGAGRAGEAVHIDHPRLHSEDRHHGR
ncbi:MAG: FHA domain-containing protein [Pirellulales bacterium]|nr:FHA domain-containing protein [Pirellulales bacterium]